MRRIGKFRLVSMVTALCVVGTFVLAPAASALSAKQFRKVANDICRQGTQLRTDLLVQHFPEGPKKTPTAAELRSFVQDYKSVVQQQIDSLAALKPPANLKSKMGKLLSSARGALAKVVAKPTIGSPTIMASMIARRPA